MFKTSLKIISILMVSLAPYGVLANTINAQTCTNFLTPFKNQMRNYYNAYYGRSEIDFFRWAGQIPDFRHGSMEKISRYETSNDQAQAVVTGIRNLIKECSSHCEGVIFKEISTSAQVAMKCADLKEYPAMRIEQVLKNYSLHDPTAPEVTVGCQSEMPAQCLRVDDIADADEKAAISGMCDHFRKAQRTCLAQTRDDRWAEHQTAPVHVEHHKPLPDPVRVENSGPVNLEDVYREAARQLLEERVYEEPSAI